MYVARGFKQLVDIDEVSLVTYENPKLDTSQLCMLVEYNP